MSARARDENQNPRTEFAIRPSQKYGVHSRHRGRRGNVALRPTEKLRERERERERKRDIDPRRIKTVSKENCNERLKRRAIAHA